MKNKQIKRFSLIYEKVSLNLRILELRYFKWRSQAYWLPGKQHCNDVKANTTQTR